MSSQLQIGVLLPEVLGTYGDSGNAVVLQKRAEWRGIDARIVPLSLEDPIPSSLDIYTMGGGEDTAQALAASYIRGDKGLHNAVVAGAPVLAICASMQILGSWYEDAQGRTSEGLELLDCHTVPQGRRSIGEIITQPLIEGLTDKLTGFENHGGATILGPDARPLGKVLLGVGNAAPAGEDDPGVEGVVQGSIIATYMHGPALARNPQLADYLLEKAIGDTLEPLRMPEVDALRAERLSQLSQ